MASFLDEKTISQLAEEYDRIDLAGILTELVNWKSGLSRHWAEDITAENIDTFIGMLIDHSYKGDS